VKLLIANDVDLSRTCLDGWTALHKAALWGHNDLVKILLDAKLDLNKKDSKENTPLQLAVEMRHFYIVNIICRFDYNHTLSSRSSTKDVGIWFDSRLVFDVHISSVVAASLKLLGFIFRSCNEFRSAKCLTTLYFSVVGSRFEYGSIIWSPYYAT
jgi:ankyrin repeat protein